MGGKARIKPNLDNLVIVKVKILLLGAEVKAPPLR